MKKDSFMIKDDRNLCKSHFGCYFRLSLLISKKKKNSFFEHMGYLWLGRTSKKSCLDSEHIKSNW